MDNEDIKRKSLKDASGGGEKEYVYFESWKEDNKKVEKLLRWIQDNMQEILYIRQDTTLFINCKLFLVLIIQNRGNIK